MGHDVERTMDTRRMTDKLDQDILEFALATRGLFEPHNNIPRDLSPLSRSDLSDPPFLPSFTPEEKLAAVEREIAIRRRVYPNRVLTRRMSQKFADEQIAVLVAIAADYRGKVA